MSELKIGDTAPDFTRPTDGDGSFTLSEQKGKKVVLFFYPKDNTPGCTKEACGFNDNLKEFEGLNVQIVGISKDSVKKHDNFKAKFGFNYPLVSDEDGGVLENYGVWKEKSMYGKTFLGIERSTFLIDENGKIAEIWRKVKVNGHIEEVLDTVKEMKKAA